jgi:hypothetical protein
LINTHTGQVSAIVSPLFGVGGNHNCLLIDKFSLALFHETLLPFNTTDGRWKKEKRKRKTNKMAENIFNGIIWCLVRRKIIVKPKTFSKKYFTSKNGVLKYDFENLSA